MSLIGIDKIADYCVKIYDILKEWAGGLTVSIDGGIVTEQNSTAILNQTTNSANSLAILDAAVDANDNLKTQLYIDKDGTSTKVSLDTTLPYSNVPIPVVLTDITGQAVVNVNITDSALNVESIIRDKDNNPFSSTSNGAGQRSLDIEVKNLSAIEVDGTVSVTGSTTPTDDFSNPTTATLVQSHLMNYDGSKWDMTRGTSTDGLLVNLGSNNDVTVTGSVSVSNMVDISNLATSAKQLADNHNVKVNSSTEAITSTSGALDVNIKSNSSTNPTDIFSIARVDTTSSATYYYYGFLDKDANWYIMRETVATSVYEYYYSTSATAFTGASGWSNRALITYVEFNSAF